jgi:hypothetical protein
LLQIVLIVLVETIPEYVGPQALCGIIVAAGIAWVAIILHFMPFTNHHMNQLHLSMAFIFLSSAIAATIGEGLPIFDAAVSAHPIVII